MAMAAALLAPLAACGGSGVTNESALATVTIRTEQGVRTFHMEVADTAAKQERGLQFRSQIPADGGLLNAPYPPDGGEPKEVDFWTKNVPISVDFIFVRADGTIARIAENAVPQSEDLIPSGEPVAAVLEIRGGRSAELGIAPGDVVSWPGQKSGAEQK